MKYLNTILLAAILGLLAYQMHQSRLPDCMPRNGWFTQEQLRACGLPDDLVPVNRR